MTAREKNQMSELREEFHELKTTLRDLASALDKMNRGLYGDKTNNVIGLIERQNEDDKRYKNHEARLKKIEKEISDKKLIFRTAVVVGIFFIIVTLLATKTVDISTIFNFFK